MSIVIGITKGSTEADRKKIGPIVSDLIDAGYVRRIMVNDEDVIVQTFTQEPNEIMPAYMMDRIVREAKK